jgi:hypothetical protein
MKIPTTLPSSIQHFDPGALLDQIQMLHRWPAQGDLLTLCYKMGPAEAALFVILGVIFLLFGINIFKILVMANAALLGAVAGAWIGDRGGNAPVGAVVGAFIAAALSWPLMKHAVAIMGALIGAMVGASAWHVANQNPEFAWAGAACGAATFGLLSFVLFRGCVIMFTSLQGAAMIVIGVLALLFKYPEFAPKLASLMSAKQYILPLAVLFPALCGLVFQHSPTAHHPHLKPAAKKPA